MPFVVCFGAYREVPSSSWVRPAQFFVLEGPCRVVPGVELRSLFGGKTCPLALSTIALTPVRVLIFFGGGVVSATPEVLRAYS